MLIPHSLTVLLTSRCNASCDHCCMNSGPSRDETLDGQTAVDAISDLFDKFPLKVVVFAGGEPTLVKDALHSGIKYCRSLGVVTRIVTNASWATSFPRARKTIEQLRNSGLDEINFSADDFHLPYVPLENIIRAWKATKGAGFSSVIIANGSSHGSIVTPRFLMRQLAEDLQTRFSESGIAIKVGMPSSDGTLYGISNTRFQKLARARDRISSVVFQDVDNWEAIGGGCNHVLKSPALSPKGHLLACCGFELEGNPILDLGPVAYSSASALIEAGNRAPILKAIAFLGPTYLKEVIERFDPNVIFPKSYGSVCEICQSIVQNPRAINALECNLFRLIPTINAVFERRERTVR